MARLPRPPQDNADASQDEDRIEDVNDDFDAEEGEQDDDENLDEGEGDEEAEGEGLGDEAPRQPEARREPSQRETSVQRAQRLARESRAEADALRREMADLRAEVQRARAPSETPEQESARLALMDPEQRAEYRFNKAMDNQNRQMAQMQARLADQADKSAFLAACASDPLLKTVAAEVETELANVRRQGQNVDREALANYLIGKRARSRAPAAVSKQRKAGERNIARQQGRPGAGRSDREPENRRGDEARRRRLEDVVF